MKYVSFLTAVVAFSISCKQRGFQDPAPESPEIREGSSTEGVSARYYTGNYSFCVNMKIVLSRDVNDFLNVKCYGRYDERENDFPCKEGESKRIPFADFQRNFVENAERVLNGKIANYKEGSRSSDAQVREYSWSLVEDFERALSQVKTCGARFTKMIKDNRSQEDLTNVKDSNCNWKDFVTTAAEIAFER